MVLGITIVRLYVTNDSYPELREIDAQWARTRTWWRAISRAARTRDFWVFVAAQAAVFVAPVLAAAVLSSALGLERGTTRAVDSAAIVAGAIAFAYLQVSWGGDMMRRHLRAVSETARYACPRCGQNLFGHLDEGRSAVRCPECADDVDRAVFEPPYPIPRHLRAFPPWRRG